ncbi:MAG: hypothetical protein AAF629_00315 [Chloroflexota bacterium]
MQTTDIWAEASPVLATKMTKGTYDHNLKSATLAENGTDHFTLFLANDLVRDWVENRLDGIIRQTLSNVADRPIKITYDIIANQTLSGQKPDPITTKLDWAADVDWRNIQNKSYMPLSTYAVHFWQPWLNQRNARTFALWLAIRGDDKRIGAAHDSFVDFWTPPRTFRISKLAGEIGSKNSTTSLTGRFAPCNRCYKALQAEEPLKQCCGHHKPSQWKQLAEDKRMCQYWSVGAFESLQEAGLLAVDANVGQTKKHSLKLQVWMLLPVLTPQQVDTLPQTLQNEHRLWLASYGHFFDLSEERWDTIELPTLLSCLPHYQEKRQLGTYEWNKIKREQLE